MDHYPPITPIYPPPVITVVSLVGVLGVDLAAGRLLVCATEAIGDLLALLRGDVVAGLLGEHVESCWYC